MNIKLIIEEVLNEKTNPRLAMDFLTGSPVDEHQAHQLLEIIYSIADGIESNNFKSIQKNDMDVIKKICTKYGHVTNSYSHQPKPKEHINKQPEQQKQTTKSRGDSRWNNLSTAGKAKAVLFGYN